MSNKLQVIVEKYQAMFPMFNREAVINEGSDYVLKTPITANCPLEMTKELAVRLMTIAYDEYE